MRCALDFNLLIIHLMVVCSSFFLYFEPLLYVNRLQHTQLFIFCAGLSFKYSSNRLQKACRYAIETLLEIVFLLSGSKNSLKAFSSRKTIIDEVKLC